MQLSINNLLSWHNEGKQPRIDRVLYINLRINLICTIDIADPKALPQAHPYTDIESSLRNINASIVIAHL